MSRPVVRSRPISQSSAYESSVVRTNYRTDSVSQRAAERHISAKPAASSIDSDAALLTVAVPRDDATLTVNGHKTTSSGKVRQFMSRGLKEGFVYTYEVQVTYTVGGEEKTESKSVKLRPGDTERVVFDAPAIAEVVQEDPITVVRLYVPSDAQVTLAGNATDGRGSTRTFRTKQLKAGQQWSDYTIRVTHQVHGQPVSKERTVNVAAGSTTELTFDFDDSELAQR